MKDNIDTRLASLGGDLRRTNSTSITLRSTTPPISGTLVPLFVGIAAALSLMGHDEERSTTATDEGKATPDRSSSPSPLGDVDSDETVRKPAQASEEPISKLESINSPRTAPSSPTTDEERRPPLPPRPKNLSLLQGGNKSSLQVPKRSPRPDLQSLATTALSRTDIHTQIFQDGSRETTAYDAQTTPPSKYLGGFSSIRRFKGFGSSEGDSASVKSYAPTLEAGGDVESLLGEVLGSSQESPAWKMLSAQIEAQDPFELVTHGDDEVSADFYREFDAIGEMNTKRENEGTYRLPTSKSMEFH